MPELTPADLADFRALVAKQTEIADYIRGNLGLDGAGGDSSVYDLKSAGVDLTGFADGQKAKIEAAVLDALDDFQHDVGRALVGCGVIKVSETINYRHAAVDMPAARHQAVAGFQGTMIQVGRYGSTTDNTRRSVPTHQSLLAWCGTPSTGIVAGTTAFHLTDDICPGSRYRFAAGYAEVAAYCDGNWEKQRTEVSASDCGTVLQLVDATRPQLVAGVPTGITERNSSDSCVWTLSATNCRQLFKLVDNAANGGGADMSGIVNYICEAAVPSNPPVPLIHDENDKMMSHGGIVRGGKGIGDSEKPDGLYCDLPRNDGIDSIHFLGLRFTTFGGTAVHARRGRNILGEVVVRGGTNGGTWNPATKTVDDTRTVPCPTMLFEQWISAGGLRPVVISSIATYGLQHGTDTYWSRGTSFGPAAVAMGAFSAAAGQEATQAVDCNRPKNGWYPFSRTAIRYHKGERCYWPNAEVQGKISWGAGLVDCTTEAPAPWVQTSYDGTVEPGGSFTHIVRGSVSFGEAVAATWVAKFTGEQVARFETISDLDGMAATYKRGLWTLEGQHRVSTVSLQGSASNLNRYFRRAGLVVAPESGARAGEPFVAQPDGSWRSGFGGAAIVPAQMAATTALLARMSVQPSAAFAAVYDRLLFELTDIGVLAGAVTGHLFAGHDAAASRLALFPSAGGATWHDTTAQGAPAFTAGRGYATVPPIVTVASAPAAGTTLTIAGPASQMLTITFASAVTAINAGQPTATVDRRTAVAQIAADIAAVIANRNQNTAGYLAVTSNYTAGDTFVRLGAAPTGVTHNAGAALTVNAWGRLASDYDMSVAAETLSATDMLMVAVSGRVSPGYGGSQNGYEFESGNGRMKFRVRDGNAIGSAGGVNTLGYPAGAALMPAPKMFGALGANQFAIDGGRVVAQAARASSLGAPDLMSFGGGREIALVLLLRASDLIETASGVVRAKDERLLRLHRACVAAYQSARALA